MAKKAAKSAKTRPSPPRVKPAIAQRQDAFLAVIAKCANITIAAESVGVDRSAHYRWLADPTYRKRFLEAREAAYDRLEHEAWQRALSRSDRLLMFLLSAYRPKFRLDGQAVIAAGDDLSELPERQLLEQAEAELREMGFSSLQELWGSGS